MHFRALFSGCLLLLGLATTAPGDTPAGISLGYEYVADQCGDAGQGRAYSAAEFAKAKAEAAAHLAHLNKADRKSGSFKAKIEEVTRAAQRIKDCEKKQDSSLSLPPMPPCADIVKAYNDFTARASRLQEQGLVTASQRDAARERFRGPVYKCAKERIKKCIDPNNTAEVYAAVDLLELAVRLKVIGSYASDKGAGGVLASINPLLERPKFCTDTDYQCTADKALCDYFVGRIRDAMESYISRFRG